MFKELILKQLLKRQGVPPAQIDVLVGLVGRNPELFKTIGEEVKREMAAGKSQELAAMEVLRRHQGEIQQILHTEQ